jgi:hypothetical protein
VLAAAGLAATCRSALGRRQLSCEGRLQRPQRRRLEPALPRLAPHRRDVAAETEVAVAQLRRQPDPTRTRAAPLERPAGRDPAPQRALADTCASGRGTDIAGAQRLAVT